MSYLLENNGSKSIKVKGPRNLPYTRLHGPRYEKCSHSYGCKEQGSNHT